MSHAAPAGDEADDRAQDGPTGPVGDVPGTDLAVPAARPGPSLLEADTWAEPPTATMETYEGRRRADPPSRRQWLVIALVLVGLGVLVAVPVAFYAGAGGGSAAPTGIGDHVNDPTADQSLAPDASLVPPMSAAAQTTDPPKTPKPTTGPSKTTVPAFAPLTLEAEAKGVSLTGSARVSTYQGASNGSIVRNVGNWGDGSPGKITFNNVLLPTAGTYVITVYFVHLDNEQNRSAQIAVSGAEAINQTFAGSSVCCASKALPGIALAAGTHTITISNQSGRAPSIDKIVITRV